MKHTGRTTGRRLVALGITLLIASGTILATGLAAVAQDAGTDANGYRIDPGELGGFQTDANMTPIKIAFFEPVLPVPVGPGEPQGELSLQFTRALVGTGPSSRGLSSSFWLGAIVGDGFPELCGCPQQYPFKADAKYPDGPFDHTDNSDTNSGAGMQAYAHGLDAGATAQSGGQIIPTVLSAGFMDSATETSVAEGVATVETMARISNLDFMEGLIKLDEFQSSLSATTNGELGESSGSVTIAGLTVAGQTFRVTDQGVIQGEGTDEEIIVDFGGGKSIELLSSMGVEVQFAGFNDDDSGPAASRATQGLQITLDLSPIKEFVDSFNLPVSEVISQIPLEQIDGIEDPTGQIPDEIRSVPDNPIFCSNIGVGNCLKASLFTLATLSPKVVVTLGQGQASAVASTPFSFDFPTPAIPPAPSSPGASVGTFVPSTTTPSFTTEPAAPQVADGAAPAPAAPVPVALASDTPLSTPVGAAAIVMGLIGAAVLAQGISMVGSSVVGPMSPAGTSASQVPDLRSF